MYILSVTLIFEISRSKVKILEKVFKFISIRIIRIFFVVIFIFIEILRFLFHPIFFRLILIFMALFIRIIIIKFNISWFFFLLMLVFLGGVIILVIYINTLIINEKIFSVKLTKSLSVILIRGFFFFLRKNTFYKISINRFRAIIIYEKINFFLLGFLIIYLLLTLICVVKLIKFEFGPLIKRL